MYKANALGPAIATCTRQSFHWEFVKQLCTQ